MSPGTTQQRTHYPTPLSPTTHHPTSPLLPTHFTLAQPDPLQRIAPQFSAAQRALPIPLSHHPIPPLPTQALPHSTPPHATSHDTHCPYYRLSDLAPITSPASRFALSPRSYPLCHGHAAQHLLFAPPVPAPSHVPFPSLLMHPLPAHHAEESKGKYVLKRRRRSENLVL